ncbi:helix-turn-helix domain-containing protein [Flavonifractor sp. DFI.6.63]|uniref:helix-turn-helix domain-containing protein n=1 Tax=Flavonifractor sp. DFI.6.63 TaxID=2963704 RepID=UPI002109500A|nr:helix-turn-helix transcriptional regulator [Flavonifractor sp. DFI.6.63]MCQ5028692.1 helix-turn-helix domain-containing protein [Flavonifractor sp. DFI.6.63]
MMAQSDDFPQRLRFLRERKQLSRRALAELCGLSKNMISMYERGEKIPSVEVLIILADFFGVTTDYLLGRKKYF